jgi:hypothetical protein
MPTVNATFRHGKIDELFENLNVVMVVGYTADYAPYVEFPTSYTGTAPPFDPIHEWVSRKWNDLDSGLRDLADGDTLAERKRQVAWIVQAAIAENGTDGVFFLSRSFEAAKQASEQFLAQFEGSDDIEAAPKAFMETAEFAFETSQNIIAQEASDTGTLAKSGYVVVETSGETYFNQEGRA